MHWVKQRMRASRALVLWYGAAGYQDYIFLVMDQRISTVPRPFHRKAVIWIVTHTLAFAIGVQLSIVMLWCISFWHDGKLVVTVHVVRIILQFDGSGQAQSVRGCAAETHVLPQTKNPGTDLYCSEWRQSLLSSSLFCDESLNNQW